MTNSINHKCPYCGYTTEFDCWRKNDKGEFETVTIQGDESFIIIKSCESDTYAFRTDTEIKADWDPPVYEKTLLLGCPKCGVFHLLKIFIKDFKETNNEI